MIGYRHPRSSEIYAASIRAEIKYSRHRRNETVYCVILLILGCMAMTGIPKNGILSTMISIILFRLFGTCLRERTLCNKKIAQIAAGEFLVLDGWVDDIQTNFRRPGTVIIRFQSTFGQTAAQYLPVRRENVTEGTPVILVVSDQVKGGIRWAFTPYMLTEEGCRQWI